VNDLRSSMEIERSTESEPLGGYTDVELMHMQARAERNRPMVACAACDGEGEIDGDTCAICEGKASVPKQ
jgi:DnaJ-class molecular chaperone